MPRAARLGQPPVTGGPVPQLAAELRRARNAAGLTYSQLAAETGLSVATLQAAAAGTRRPTWKVTRAFASACGGDQDKAWALWAAACREAGLEPPGQPPEDPPDPAGAISAAELVGMLKLLLRWAGSPSLAALNRRAGGYNLPPSTVSDMLRSDRLPRLELMITFVLACGLEKEQAATWRAAWMRIKAREGDPLPAASEASGVPAPGPQEWQPALTPRKAAADGIPKREYEQAALFARIAVEEHRRLGTPRHLWEPTPIVNDKLAAPFIADGEQELASRLEKEADPALDKCQGIIENVKAGLDQIAEHARPLSTPESGTNYPAAEAAARVRQHDETIERDEGAGKRHHQRASVLLRRLATWAPWLEAAGAVGFLTFVTYYLNVPLFEPWQDWLGWSFAVVVVVVTILGQTWLVRHAGKSHNHAREDRVNGHRTEAERGFRQRNWCLAGTAVTAVPIISGIIWRGTAALGSAGIGTAAVVFAAAVTGLVLPILAYLGIALDGSTVSRERDGLAADLKDDLDDYRQTLSDSRRDLVIVGETGGTLRNKTFPDICHATQEAVDAVYGFYGAVRLLIGGLPPELPARTTNTIERDAAGTISGYIGTSIPGTGTVNLDPLFDRQRRLDEIEAQRAGLLHRIDALPAHPPTLLSTSQSRRTGTRASRGVKRIVSLVKEISVLRRISSTWPRISGARYMNWIFKGRLISQIWNIDRQDTLTVYSEHGDGERSRP